MPKIPSMAQCLLLSKNKCSALLIKSPIADLFVKVNTETLPMGIAENVMVDQVMQAIQSNLDLPKWAGHLMNFGESLWHLFK